MPCLCPFFSLHVKGFRPIILMLEASPLPMQERATVTMTFSLRSTYDPQTGFNSLRALLQLDKQVDKDDITHFQVYHRHGQLENVSFI
jgi:hypothetical protein